MYVVTKRSDKSKYWKKTKELAPTKNQPKEKRAVGAKPKKDTPGKGPITIQVGEVYVGDFDNSRSDPRLNITEAFYCILLKKPKYIIDKTNVGNAYIFGKKFPIKSYEKIGYHGNDGAQTGIVDITNITVNDLNAINNNNGDLWLSLYNISSGKTKSWDDRSVLQLVRDQISDRILFVGDTYGGDVGADVLVHYNNKKEINGLILDNNVYTDIDND